MFINIVDSESCPIVIFPIAVSTPNGKAILTISFWTFVEIKFNGKSDVFILNPDVNATIWKCIAFILDFVKIIIFNLPPSSFRILEGNHQQGSTPGDLFSRVQTTALYTIVPKKLFFKNTNNKQSLCTPFPPPPKIETNIFSSSFFYDRISAHRSVPCVVGPQISYFGYNMK